MQIIYADDAPVLLDEVCHYLGRQGHDTIGLETRNLLDFQDRLDYMLETGFKPEALIIGGNNLLRNASGEPLLNLAAFDLCTWLSKKEAMQNCRLILFSRHEAIRRDALQHPEWGISYIVDKEDPDYLSKLAQAIKADAP
jgi:hypothetical protein